MLKIVGVVDDKYRVLDDEDNIEQLATIEELYVAKATGVWVEGCHFTRDGLVTDIDGKLCSRGSVEVPEVWRPVVQFNVQEPDGRWRYEVSNKGRVRSLHGCGYRTGIPKLLRKNLNRGGYEILALHRNNVGKTFSVGRLVGYAFIENIRGVRDINHLDECKTNNSVDNLEWCTPLENSRYGSRTERSAMSRSVAVRQYALDGSLIAEYSSMSEATRAVVGSSLGNLTLCCRRQKSVRTCAGYVWRYVADDELFDVDVATRVGVIQSFLDLPRNFVRCVRQYTIDCRFVAEFESIVVAAKQFAGVDMSPQIIGCCRRRHFYSHGFIWRYAEDDEFADRPENKDLIAAFHSQES